MNHVCAGIYVVCVYVPLTWLHLVLRDLLDDLSLSLVNAYKKDLKVDFGEDVIINIIFGVCVWTCGFFTFMRILSQTWSWLEV